jgi:hypothetical protein
VDRSFAVLVLAACAWSGDLATVDGGMTAFFSGSDWRAATGGPEVLTVLSFQGPTEVHNTPVNDPGILPSYASQGVVFLPFTGTDVYPLVARGQQWQISAPDHDGLVVNSSSPNPNGDLEGRAIRFTFVIPVRAVGLHFNGPYLGGDMGYLKIFDYGGTPIGQTGICSAGGFVGVVADTEIAEVRVVNTGNADITFGIWDLQFRELPALLRIRKLPSGARLSWPATAQGYVLEDTGSLSPTIWLPVPTTPTVMGNDLVVDVATAAPQRFYRLQRP